MRIATFNVNSIRARLDAVLAWLAKHQPDALCLQETKVQDHEFPEAELRAAGYRAVFRGEKSYNGVALISKEEVQDVQFGFSDDGPSDATRLLTARLGKVRIVNTYVPQGRELDHPQYSYKLEWFARLRAWFETHASPKETLVWAGDLNVVPEPRDVHNPERQTNHVCFHESVRTAFAYTCAWGFKDVFRQFNQESGQYSFFDYRTKDGVARGQGWRVDHILATPPLAAKARACRIDLEPRLQPKPSDHTPVMADFDV